MGKIYATDGKIISDGFPQIQVGEKLYRVDTRKSTFDRIQAEVTGDSAEETDIILRHALGGEAFEEIKALDLTVSGYMNLLIFVQAAIYDITFEEAEARFQKAQ